MMQIKVDLGERSYHISFQSAGIEQIQTLIQALSIKPNAIALITDHNVDKYYGERAMQACELLDIPVSKISLAPGEGSKSVEVLMEIFAAFVKAKLNRQSLVIALGGGVIGDIAGFAAGTFMRGMPIMQIPTSLLAQVDASVGGKTAINLPWGKNLFGVFQQPKAVLIDVQTLETLPEEELHNGLAEIIKVAAVADAELFSILENNRQAIQARDEKILLQIIMRAVEIKARIVAQDERDTGRRMLLNFGHTVGHAIEASTDYQGIRHGEAVAIGMAVAGKLSRDLNQFSAQDHDRLINLLESYELSIHLPKDIKIDQLLNFMLQDKKKSNAALRFVLLNKIGCGGIVNDVPFTTVGKFLEKYY